jgi:hypothetical protein
MLEQTITLKLPMPVLGKLKRAAELTYRSLDEIVASTINATLTAPPGMPAHLSDELAVMHLLSDEALWAAAQPTFSPAQRLRLEQLNHIAGARELTKAESAEQAALLEAYDYSILHRAQALAILAQRGHRVQLEDPWQANPYDQSVDSASLA